MFMGLQLSAQILQLVQPLFGGLRHAPRGLLQTGGDMRRSGQKGADISFGEMSEVQHFPDVPVQSGQTDEIAQRVIPGRAAANEEQRRGVCPAVAPADVLPALR